MLLWVQSSDQAGPHTCAGALPCPGMHCGDSLITLCSCFFILKLLSHDGRCYSGSGVAWLTESRFPGHRAALVTEWPWPVCSHPGWELSQRQLLPVPRWGTAGPPAQHRQCTGTVRHWVSTGHCAPARAQEAAELCHTNAPCAAAHPVHNSRDNSVRDNHNVGLALWQNGVFYACWAELTLCPLPVCFLCDAYAFWLLVNSVQSLFYLLLHKKSPSTAKESS